MTEAKKAETKATAPLTRGQKVNRDITALLKAGNSLLWVVSREELRAESAIIDAAGAATYETTFWDVAAGHTDAKGTVIDVRRSDPRSMLGFIGENAKRGVFVMRDLHKWLGDALTLRKLRSLARALENDLDPARMRRIIVLSPVSEIPPELTGHAVVLDYPLPDRTEMGIILDRTIASIPDEKVRAQVAPNGTREAAIDASIGLSSQEATNCFARSLVESRKIVPSLIAAEKKRVIERERVLTWHDPDPRGLDAIGGLENVKGWLVQRKTAFSQKARAFGLPAPKGLLLVGLPGTGKSLIAKCAPTAFQMPLLRIDFGALQSKFVGESQQNIRKALAVAETVSPCVVLADEIDKAMAGAGSAASDGGVAADAAGTFLTWMQEREGTVFVIATANDVSGLPPEMLRKGRFDEVFFVDLPTKSERGAILVATLKQYKRSVDGIDVAKIATVTAEFTGSEIAALVPEALFVAFADGERAITTADLEAAALNLTPLSKTMADKLERIRKWGQTNARPASAKEIAEVAGTTRAIDLDPSAN